MAPIIAPTGRRAAADRLRLCQGLYCGAILSGGFELRPILVLLALALSAAAHAAPTEIQFWHAMGGPVGKQVDAIVQKFNAAQKDYVVVPTYKGNYDETMAAAFIAYRSGTAPHVVQIYDLGTQN